MTEDEWAVAEDEAIWRVVMALSPRRQRLLASAAVRSLGKWSNYSDVAAGLEATERFADTGKSKAALKRARDALFDARVALVTSDPGVPTKETLGVYAAMRAAGAACAEEQPISAIREVVLTWREAESVSKEEARRRVYPVFREVAGPTPPPTFDPAWRTGAAVAIARQMYESRDFSAMPILADALQDAGCDGDDILNHCRDPRAVHARGCWVVDLVLGKN